MKAVVVFLLDIMRKWHLINLNGKRGKSIICSEDPKSRDENFVVIVVVLDLPIIFYTRYSLISYDLVMKFHMEAG